MKRFAVIAAAVGLLAALSLYFGGASGAATDETLPDADAQAV